MESSCATICNRGRVDVCTLGAEGDEREICKVGGMDMERST